MILLKQNVQDYNNDLRAMIMAFFPGEKIVSYEKKQEDNESFCFMMEAFFDDKKTSLTLIKPDGLKVCDKDINGNYSDRKEFRNIFKLALYRLLSDFTGKRLPWGDLTGVRPTKIAMKAVKEEKEKNEILDYYIKTYDTSERKAALAFEVAKNELGLINGIDLKNSYCLYIGIPFCPSRCLYCSFAAYAIESKKDKVDGYLDRLCEELSFIAKKYKDKNLVAIYMGGGTPTSVNYKQLDRLLTHVDKVFDLHNKENIDDDTEKDAGMNKKLLEYTIEAGRPDSITKEKLLVMKKHGVTRISINPQTMNDETLKRIGRAHSVKQLEDAYEMARECGFDNINMDIIAGLPGEDKAMMERTLTKIRDMKPESLTVHSLAIKRAAKLNESLDEYKADINHDVDEMLDMVNDTAEDLSMKPYYLYRQKNIGGNLENVGYALAGKECLYNVLIMEELTDIIAAGAGASSKYVIRDENDNVIRIDRSENCKSLDDYIDRFDEMIARKC
ncbi:MAG: coproporphyrinogen dehydrogenase HemZ [Lachnospiraceae bacterium]|nr:coproporphyrinogen dehydrogenase HemZ [Lachnospiraceae bacterium]